MKKVLAVLLCVAMILGFAACGEKESQDPVESNNNATWDRVEYDTIDEINKLLALKMCAPGVMGVTDHNYGIISGNLADLYFSVNGIKYNFRGTPDFSIDPSGVYVDGKTAFEGKTPTDAIDYIMTGECKLARWATIDGQYVLNIADNGTVEEATFKSIAEELQAMTKPGMSDTEKQAFYEDLAGEYADSVSQRATATVTAQEGSVLIDIFWGNGAEETYEWTMTASLGEDGLLNYSDEKAQVISGENITVNSENGSGFFAYDETAGTLAWTGAASENCQSCVFEKIQ